VQWRRWRWVSWRRRVVCDENRRNSKTRKAKGDSRSSSNNNNNATTAAGAAATATARKTDGSEQTATDGRQPTNNPTTYVCRIVRQLSPENSKLENELINFWRGFQSPKKILNFFKNRQYKRVIRKVT
jgi:hypothetical protein